jgi:hypothetical protein
MSLIFIQSFSNETCDITPSNKEIVIQSLGINETIYQ